MLTGAPKGTKDMLPGEAYKWRYVREEFRKTALKYGFKQIDTPVFEHTELFNRGVGDSTDIVQKEMYTFLDHGGRSITLRPEGTSPVVRSYVENKLYAEPQPVKLFYDISCFRYERPQAGRLRQFHQLGIEVFGSPDMLADAEVIALGYEFLTRMGVKELELRVNSIGCPECRGEYREALRAYLKKDYDRLCDTCKSRYESNPMRILDCKSEICGSIVRDAPRITDYLCDECREAFAELQGELRALSIPFTIDPSIVRGLDYYTKTAFEFVTASGRAQSAVCGGGRYDNLIEQIGGPSAPGVGFGLGIERLLLTMEDQGAVIPAPEGTEVFVAVLGDEAREYGLRLTRELRSRGINTEMDLMGRNMKGQIKCADRSGASIAVIIGENELRSGRLSLRFLNRSEQTEVAAAEAVSRIEEELG